MKKLLFILWIIIFNLLMSTQVVRAGHYTDKEYARLPSYCKARLEGRKSPQNQYWAKRMGLSFGGIHHYCYGLHFLNKLLVVTSRGERYSLLNKAIKQFEMTRDFVSRDFYLRPEIGNKIGNCYLRIGNIPEAVNVYLKEIKLYPKYTLNYARLSKIYKKQGDIAKAKEILEQGLKHNPSSKLLKKRLKKLEK